MFFGPCVRIRNLSSGVKFAVFDPPPIAIGMVASPKENLPLAAVSLFPLVFHQGLASGSHHPAQTNPEIRIVSIWRFDILVQLESGVLLLNTIPRP